MRLFSCVLICLGLAACGGGAAYRNGPGPAAQFDLGAVSPAASPDARPWRFSVLASGQFEDRAMRYRLLYADGARVMEYGQSRWVAVPGELLQRRLEARLFWPPSGPVSQCSTSLELRRFEQVFDAPTSSSGVLVMRAVLRKRGGGMVDERVLSREVAAPTPDAEGGVQALAQAVDALAGQLLDWQEQGRENGMHRVCWE